MVHGYSTLYTDLLFTLRHILPGTTLFRYELRVGITLSLTRATMPSLGSAKLGAAHPDIKKRFANRRPGRKPSSDIEFSTNIYTPGSYGESELSINHHSGRADNSCAGLSVGYESVDKDDLRSVGSAYSAASSDVSKAKKSRKVKGGLLGLTKAKTLEKQEASSKQRAADLCTAFELNAYHETTLNKSGELQGQKKSYTGASSVATQVKPKNSLLNSFRNKKQDKK